MYETDEDLVIKANVAGVPSDKVDVSLEGGVVTIRAEHQETEEEKNKKRVVYKESRSAQYLYTTSIPTAIKSDKAKAEIKNGVLTLTIPKAEESKPKRIKVTAEGK
jgi:HSP20 family protein